MVVSEFFVLPTELQKLFLCSSDHPKIMIRHARRLTISSFEFDFLSCRTEIAMLSKSRKSIENNNLHDDKTFSIVLEKNQNIKKGKNQ